MNMTEHISTLRGESSSNAIDTLEPSLLESLGGKQEQIPTATELEAAQAAPSSHYSPGQTSSTEEKALHLLGSGVASEQVASALGVTPSRIAQLLAEESFAVKVAALRYESLQKHNKRDGAYDSLEDQLLIKLERSLPLLIKPESILKAIAIVNGAKRRGQSAPQQVTNTQNVVNLILPQVIAQKFTVNLDNQVIRAGAQELLTMPSGNLLKQVEEATATAAAARLESPEEQITAEEV
jgi:hypothetical protein